MGRLQVASSRLATLAWVLLLAAPSVWTPAASSLAATPADPLLSVSVPWAQATTDSGSRSTFDDGVVQLPQALTNVYRVRVSAFMAYAHSHGTPVTLSVKLQPSGATVWTTTLAPYDAAAMQIDATFAPVAQATGVEIVASPPQVRAFHDFEDADRVVVYSATAPETTATSRFGFEPGAQGWTHGGAMDEWERGAPAHGGSFAFATDLDGDYENDADAWLQSPLIPLGPASPQVSWWQSFQAEPCCDAGHVRASADGGATWTTLASYQGNQSAWAQRSLDLSAYAGRAILLRFALVTDGSGVASGWSVDDVAFRGVAGAPPALPERVPGAPLALVAAPGPDGGQVTLAWAPPADGGEGQLRYTVYRGAQAGGPKVAVASLSDATTFTDAGLAGQATHYYEVAATNDHGEGPRSIEASAVTFGRPGAPTSLVATPGPAQGQVTLAWAPPGVAGGSSALMPGALSYVVYRGNASGNETRYANVSSTTFADLNVSPERTYHYRVAAVNPHGEGPRSAEAAASPYVVDGPYDVIEPGHGGALDKVRYKLGATVRHAGQTYGQVLEGVIDGPLPFPIGWVPDGGFWADYDWDQDGLPHAWVMPQRYWYVDEQGALRSEWEYWSETPVDPNDWDDSNPLPKIIDGPYGDVEPSHDGRVDRVRYKVGVQVRYMGATYGQVEEGTYDGPLPYSLRYPYSLERGADQDGDGVPQRVWLARREVTVTDTGSTYESDGGTVKPVPIDLNDQDPSDPVPQPIDGPYTTVVPLYEGHGDQVYYKLGVKVLFKGQEYGEVVEGVLDGPLPYTTEPYPKQVIPGLDEDGDGIPGTVEVRYQRTTVSNAGKLSSASAGSATHGLDPDDADDSNPLPKVIEAYDDVETPYEGQVDRIHYKVGLRFKWMGQTYGDVQEGVYDGPLPFTTPAYPKTLTQGPDQDGDGVPSSVRPNFRHTIVHEDGSVSSEDADDVQLQVFPDRFDNDDSYPIPKVEGPYVSGGPTPGKWDEACFQRGVIVRFMGQSYGSVEQTCIDGPLPFTTPAYPKEVRSDGDEDGDGVPKSITILYETTTFGEGGGRSVRDAGSTTLRVDPDDHDPSNPGRVPLPGGLPGKVGIMIRTSMLD